LVVVDLVPDLGQALLGQVEKGPPLELLGIDAVGDALEGNPAGLQLADEADGVLLGLGERGRLDHDGDVVEIPELLAILHPAGDGLS
jgi:hypothetical protein